jgi:predicted glycoside hydrolase/deacetylase ChbG (UPF0249 family)
VKYLIVNADDFGYGAGVNRGIVEAVDRGIVTSTSLMVNTPGTAEAVRLAAERPRLSVGIHVNFTNEAQPWLDLKDPAVCGAELRKQVDRFVELVGRLPTHVDSHQHMHRQGACPPVFRAWAAEHALPLRNEAPVTFKGGFYGQWEYGVSDPSKVSFEALQGILRNELQRGIYELGVHPGHFDAEAQYVYHADRELELRTLCDPRVRPLLDDEGIQLISYHDLSRTVDALADA